MRGKALFSAGKRAFPLKSITSLRQDSPQRAHEIAYAFFAVIIPAGPGKTHMPAVRGHLQMQGPALACRYYSHLPDSWSYCDISLTSLPPYYSASAYMHVIKINNNKKTAQPEQNSGRTVKYPRCHLTYCQIILTATFMTCPVT